MIKIGEKYLIISADDYGLCQSTNTAVQELIDRGFVKNVSLLTVCEYSSAAMEFLGGRTDVNVGIHIATTSEWEKNRWSSLSGVESLTDENGYMWLTAAEFGKRCKLGDVRKEAELQIGAVLSAGIKPNHLDSHMGTLYGIYGTPLLLPLAFSLCRRHKLAFRMITRYFPEQCPEGISPLFFRVGCSGARLLARVNGVATPDYMINPAGVLCDGTYERFRESFLEYISAIPSGVTEVYMHPSYPGDDIRFFCPDWQRRFFEYRFLQDPYVYSRLEKNRVHLIGYDRLIAMNAP